MNKYLISYDHGLVSVIHTKGSTINEKNLIENLAENTGRQCKVEQKTVKEYIKI